jgi:polyhydroxyalkanoate synthesis regulator protein
MSAAAKVQPILVKRYARSRLYDTQSQSYVSVEQLRGWAAKNVAFLGRVDGFNQQ